MRAIVKTGIIVSIEIFLIMGLINPKPVQADTSIYLTSLGTRYFQDFDALSNSTETGNLPAGWALSETKTNANNLYKPSTGNQSAGDTYSFGSSGSTDRALGGIQDGNLLPLFGAPFTNHTGGIIQSVTIKYTGEQWRLGKSARPDKIAFEFSLDATSLTDGEWLEYESLTFFTPYQDSEGTRNGNLAINRRNLEFTLPNLSIAAGETFWIRWRDYTASGNNDGLAVDDFSLTPYGTDNAPSITSMTPSNNATNLPLDTNVSITFSEPVNLTDTWFSLSCSNSLQHTAVISGGPQSFVIDPVEDFNFSDECIININGSKVSDQDTTDPPDNLDKDYTFHFSTLPPADEAPIVTFTSPSNNDVGVLLDTGLTVHFSEPVNVATGWFSLDCSNSGQHPAVLDGGPSIYILTPQSAFEYDETCTLTLNAQKITDLDENDPPESMPSNYSVRFSTLATPDIAPYVTSIIPSNNAISVPVNSNFELTFNEPVSMDLDAILIACTNSAMPALTITGGPSIFQIIPDHDFKFDDHCSITVIAQKVTDHDENDPPDYMLMDQSFNFETASTPDLAPEISQTDPVDGATNVNVSSSITLTFSEAVSVTDKWAQLVCSISGDHSFVSSGSLQTIIINPDEDFASNESCTLTLFGEQIHDQDLKDPPDQMTSNQIISFNTSSPTDEPPKVIETNPANQAVDVPVSGIRSVTFSEPVRLLSGWVDFSCIQSGKHSVAIEGGPILYTFGTDDDLDFSENCTITFSAASIHDQDADDPPDFMSADYSFSFSSEKSPDELTYPTIISDQSTHPDDGNYLYESLHQLVIRFSKQVLHDGSSDAANNLNNYRLVERGLNQVFETTSCTTIGGDDENVPIDEVIYDEGNFGATLTVNHNADLPDGSYRLIVCGDHTIRDMYGNALNNGENITITFTILATGAVIVPTEVTSSSGSGSGSAANSSNTNASTKTGLTSAVPLIPVTGFPHGMVTLLTPQLMPYKDMEKILLELPELDLKTTISEVPRQGETWDVSWLGSQAGWLEGSAFPTFEGNAVLTAHVWDSLNQPGPFYGLEELAYGDQVIIHAWGEEYVYEVREVLSVKPENVKAMMKHQEKSWLTLVTCQGYDKDSGDYQKRILVRAVLMEVK